MARRMPAKRLRKRDCRVSLPSLSGGVEESPRMNRRTPSPQSLDLGRAAYERVLASKKHRRRDSERSTDHRAVLITGIGNYWGGRVALALEDENKVTELLGMDV